MSHVLFFRERIPLPKTSIEGCYICYQLMKREKKKETDQLKQPARPISSQTVLCIRVTDKIILFLMATLFIKQLNSVGIDAIIVNPRFITRYIDF